MITIEYKPASNNISVSDLDETITRITLSPNRSLSWEGNKKVIWSLGSVCGGIAIAFTLIAGTWVMLPFAGLEILALSTGLYYVSWKLSYQHVLTLSETTLTIEKGIYRPRGRWQWQKQQSRLITSAPKHDWEAPNLTLTNDEQSIEIGNFLNRDDANELIDYLKKEILVVNNCYNAAP